MQDKQLENEALTRIGHLEAQNAAFNTRLDGFEGSLRQISHSIDKLTNLVSNNRPSLGTIGTWVGVIITLNGIITAGIHTLTDQKIKTVKTEVAQNKEELRDIFYRVYENGFSKADHIRYSDRVLQEFKELERNVEDHQKDGHPHFVIERINSLEKQLQAK